jgi:hypothetical protein
MQRGSATSHLLLVRAVLLAKLGQIQSSLWTRVKYFEFHLELAVMDAQ